MINKLLVDDFKNMIPVLFPNAISKKANKHPVNILPEILLITSYPPRECGIATYSMDLLQALNNKFSNTFSLKVCALESGSTKHVYPEEVKYTLNTSDSARYVELAQTINLDKSIHLVLIQHEFGFFQQADENAFLHFLYRLTKPVIIVFHTVLPNPNALLEAAVRKMVAACAAIVVMTKNASKVLHNDYGINRQRITVIPHGTHLVLHLNKGFLKDKYGLTGKKVLSTFGLLNSGKSIETTLDALPDIIKLNPDVVFLVIGKTHPGVLKTEGEQYRNMLEKKVARLKIREHVRFINQYLPLQDLLEYLQMTDIYLFTSKDPNQAVSGTFSYAMSCGCPIVSTPIPHAREVLQKNTGILIDFQNASQLAAGVNRLMSDEPLRVAFRESTLQRVVPTAWENSAIAHALLLRKVIQHADDDGENTASVFRRTVQKIDKIPLHYRLPAINLEHVKKMTTGFGIIQFSKINQPDINSGYTIDDNARALIAMCQHFELTLAETDIRYIRIYLEFIKYCLQPGGNFLNYVDSKKRFTEQNKAANLSDANGRAIWALGYLISKRALLPAAIGASAEEILQRALPHAITMHSTRAMAFTLKGLYYSNLEKKSPKVFSSIKNLADRLVQMYRHESDRDWHWYESYLTYANSIVPEAMLCAWLETGDTSYKEIAKTSFDFLLSRTFNKSGIKVISNKSWLKKGQEAAQYGEQPIDIAYTILALSKFYAEFKDTSYAHKMSTAFNWFLGNNHLQQIVYNPCTGGCYDGLEEHNVNLNQGAESALSYLMARLTLEKYSSS